MSSTEQQTRRSSDSAPGPRSQSPYGRPGTSKDSVLKKMPPSKTWLWFLGILFANYLLVRFLMPGPQAPITVPYTLFKAQVGKGNVQAIYSQGEKTKRVVAVRSGTLKHDPGMRPAYHAFVGSKAGWVDIHDGLPQFDEWAEPALLQRLMK